MENLKIKSVYRFDKNEIEYLSEKYNITKIIAVCFLDRTKFTLDEKGNVSISGEAAYGAFDKEQWKDVKRIVNGKKHIVGLKNDGTVVAYGDNSNGQCNVADWEDVIFLDTNGDKTIGITQNGIVLETEKEEVILPEVQIPTADDTEKEEVILPEVQVPIISETKNDVKKAEESKVNISSASDDYSKKVRKIAVTAIVIGLVALVGLIFVLNNKSTAEGECGENATYKLIGNTLYIEGTGSVKGGNYSDPFGNSVSNKIKSVVISDGVTEIGKWAFSGCKSLESITIPSSVTEIGESAFYWCSSLESITIPSSVTEIGYKAFYRCSSLKSITIPSSVTEIGYKAFYRCSSLKSITIPSSVTEINDTAFEDCDNVTIHGEAGSYAETYAESENITFKSI